MRWRPISLAGLLIIAGDTAELSAGDAADSSDSIVLSPVRAAAADEAIWVKVTVGRLPRRSLLRVTNEDGRPVGTISPFGAQIGQTSQDYTLPLPKNAARDGAVRLRLEMLGPNAAARAPTSGEVLAVQLIYVPVSN